MLTFSEGAGLCQRVLHQQMFFAEWVVCFQVLWPTVDWVVCFSGAIECFGVGVTAPCVAVVPSKPAASRLAVVPGE